MILSRKISGLAGARRCCSCFHNPGKSVWGILDEITAAGVFLRGLDLNAFDDWVSAVVHEEPFIGFGALFFPMWRVERIAKDESAGGVPSFVSNRATNGPYF